MKKRSIRNTVMSGVIGAAASLILLTGCGSSANAGTDAAAAANADQPYRMAYVCTVQDEYLGLLTHNVVDAAEERGVDLDVMYAGDDAMRMIECVEIARMKGMDAVLINLHASEEARACIETAGDMKVVFVNREPDDLSLLNENVALVASDEHFSGKFQGEYLAEYFKSQGKTEVSYVLLKGTDGLVHTELRTEGAVKAMKDAGLKVKEAAVVEADYNRLTAKEKMDIVLPDIDFDCIISNNDAMALGAIMAMEDAGIDPESVPIVGIDATDDAKDAIRKGEMAMTVYQSSKSQAKASVDAALNMLNRKALAEDTGCKTSKESPYTLLVPFVPVTVDNVDSI